MSFLSQEMLHFSQNRDEKIYFGNSGESARLPPMWPGFDSRTRRHIGVEFVVGSRPCCWSFFAGYSEFPLPCPQQPNICNSIRNARTFKLEPLAWDIINHSHTIEFNIIIDLILIDLNWPGYQNCNVPFKANTSVFIASSEPCPVRLFDVNSCRNTLAGHYQRNARVPTSVWSSRCTVDIHEIYTRLSWVKQEQSQQNPSRNAQSNLKHYTDIFAQNRYCHCRVLTFRSTISYRDGLGPYD